MPFVLTPVAEPVQQGAYCAFPAQGVNQQGQTADEAFLDKFHGSGLTFFQAMRRLSRGFSDDTGPSKGQNGPDAPAQ